MITSAATRRFLYFLLIAGVVAVRVVTSFDSLRGVVARNTGFLTLNHAQALIESTGRPKDELSQRSIAYLERATERNPGYASAWRALGYLHLEQGAESEALAAWRQVGPMADELLANGAEAEAAGNYNDALVWYQRATALNPGSVNAWLQAGYIHEVQDDWISAAAAYSSGASLVPDNSDLLFRLAHVQRQFSPSIDWNTILDLTSRAIEKDEFLHDWSHIQSHLLRGEALRSLGNPKEALAEYIWVMEQRPDDYWATLSRADLTWELERDAEEAERFFRAAIAIDAGNKWAYRLLAMFYSDLGRINEAKALFEQVLKIDPDDQLAVEWLDQH